MMKRIYFILLLGVVLAMSSCIKMGEDTDCSNGVKLYFSVEQDSKSTRALKEDEFKKVDVFVFDKDSKYIGMWSADNIELTPNYYIELPLEAGEYNIVSWGNVKDCYKYTTNFVKGETKLSDATIAIESIGSEIAENPHTLIYGNISGAKVTGQIDQKLVVSLVKNTYEINVTVNGMPATSDVFRLTVTDIVSSGNFENKVASSAEAIRYTTTCNKAANNQLIGSLTVLRLMEDRRVPELTLMNDTKSTMIFEANLIDLILKLRELNPPVVVDFDKIHTYNISLLFDSSMNVTISINGWNLPIENEVVIE